MTASVSVRLGGHLIFTNLNIEAFKDFGRYQVEVFPKSK